MPAALDFDQAVTPPIVWITAHYCFVQAQPQSMQNVLMHAASGGVGLVSMGWVMEVRAVTYATAGGVSKHYLLHLCNVVCISSSSSHNAVTCAALLSSLLRACRLHFLVNAPSNDLVSTSLGLLAPQGAFLEIGKNNIWNRLKTCGQIGPTVFSTKIKDPLTDMLSKTDDGAHAVAGAPVGSAALALKWAGSHKDDKSASRLRLRGGGGQSCEQLPGGEGAPTDLPPVSADRAQGSSPALQAPLPSLSAMLVERANASGDQAFLQAWSSRAGLTQTVTFESFASHVALAAKGLIERGVAPGDHVAFLSHPSVKFFVYAFATMHIGAVCVLLNWRQPTATLVRMGASSQCSVLVSSEAFTAQVIDEPPKFTD